MATKKSGALSQVPVFFRENTELANGKVIPAGHTHWVSAPDAAACERNRLGVILHAVSVAEKCRLPNGRVLRAEAEIVTVAPEHNDALEALEAAGKIKVLRDDDMVERHRAAWREHGEAIKAAIAEGRRRVREAEEFARKAPRSVPIPQINWDAAPAKKAS